MRFVGELPARLAAAHPVVFKPRDAALVKFHRALEARDRRLNALMNRHQRYENDHSRGDQPPHDDLFNSQYDHQRDDRKNDTPPEPDRATALLLAAERVAP